MYTLREDNSVCNNINKLTSFLLDACIYQEFVSIIQIIYFYPVEVFCFAPVAIIV